MEFHNTPQWSKLGRLHRSKIPKMRMFSFNGDGGARLTRQSTHVPILLATEGNDKNASAEKAALAGRLGMSMWQISMELITKIKSYSYVSRPFHTTSRSPLVAQ